MRFVSIVTGVLLTLACALAADLQPIPPLATRITDLTGTLNVGQQLTLEAELAALEKRKGSQIGVLIVATTQPEDIEQYAIRVFDAWKLGRMGIDDGILLIVAKDDRRVRIEVARGLEGAIPDATAARIIREYITPKFRAGDFFGGIEAATDVMIRLIDGEQLPAQSSEVYVNLPVFGVVGFFLAFLIRLFFGGAALRIRAPAMAAIFGIAAWFLTQLAGRSLMYSLAVATGWAFFAFLVSLIPSLVEGIRYSNGGKANTGSSSDFGSGGSGSSSGDGGGSSGSDGGGSFSGGGGESAGGGASGSW